MKYKILQLINTAKSAVAVLILIAVSVIGTFAQPDERSVARMTELIMARPDSDNLYIQRGNIYLYLNRPAEALADAEKALMLNPKNSDVFLLRGRVKIQLQDSDGAIADISRAVRASPTGYPLAYLMRGELHEKKGDLARAYADYLKLDELTDNPKAAQGAARLESKLKAVGIEPAKALAGIKDDERKAAQAAFQAADRFIGKLEWQLAIEQYSKAIELDPEFAAAYANRARLYGNQSEFDRAIADYEKAIRLKPDYAEAFEARGGLYYTYNKMDLALADFSEAIRLKPDFSDAYLNRGRVYSALNQENKALADWEKFLTLAPNSPNSELARGYLAIGRRQTTTTTSTNASAKSPLWNKISASLKPTDPLRGEIDDLDAELKTNNVAPARKKEILNRIEQNSTKILAAVNEALALLSVEPESQDKTVIKQRLDTTGAVMNKNVAQIVEQRNSQGYRDLRDKFDANITLFKAAVTAFNNAQTDDELRKHLMEVARLSREDKVIAEKIIAQYLRFAKNKTFWAEAVQINERNLKWVEEMKLENDIEF